MVAVLVSLVSMVAFANAETNDEMDCRLIAIEGGNILEELVNKDGERFYIIEWFDHPEKTISIINAYLEEYYSDNAEGWTWDAQHQLLIHEEADGSIRFVCVPVLISMPEDNSPTYYYDEDSDLRIEETKDGKIVAEFWYKDRYYYVFEYPVDEEYGRDTELTVIADVYNNICYTCSMGGFSWNPETMELEITPENDWETQDAVFIHSERKMLIGMIGGDAGVTYRIPVLWVISR
ncbi:MAG: hypothetical protein IJ867_00010 [Clostridia bacterium]|nr:hypothetical protein [Clostridia bacterium]